MGLNIAVLLMSLFMAAFVLCTLLAATMQLLKADGAPAPSTTSAPAPAPARVDTTDTDRPLALPPGVSTVKIGYNEWRRLQNFKSTPYEVSTEISTPGKINFRNWYLLRHNILKREELPKATTILSGDLSKTESTVSEGLSKTTSTLPEDVSEIIITLFKDLPETTPSTQKDSNNTIVSDTFTQALSTTTSSLTEITESTLPVITTSTHQDTDRLPQEKTTSTPEGSHDIINLDISAATLSEITTSTLEYPSTRPQNVSISMPKEPTIQVPEATSTLEDPNTKLLEITPKKRSLHSLKKYLLEDVNVRDRWTKLKPHNLSWKNFWVSPYK